MRHCKFVIAVACVLFAAATAAADEKWTFEDAKAGKLPEGWSSAKTGKVQVHVLVACLVSYTQVEQRVGTTPK